MANLFMRFPNGLAKALTFSYDDGVESDIRFMNILDKYGMKGTFNINSGGFAPEGTIYPKGTIRRRMTKSQCLNVYTNCNHEIAIHGYSHPFLNSLPPATATAEIMNDRKNLEEMYGKIIRGGAYPFGAYNDTVVEILKNSGVAYCRTTQSTYSFDLPTDWLRLHPTCAHGDKKLFELADSFINATNTRFSKLFYIWGHTYEFEEHNNWNIIETLCEKLAKSNDIWYCTNIELYDYMYAYEHLQFSIDMKFVRNMSALKVWFEYNDKVYEADSGKTIAL